MDEEKKEGRKCILPKNEAILTASETRKSEPFKLGETVGEPR